MSRSASRLEHLLGFLGIHGKRVHPVEAFLSGVGGCIAIAIVVLVCRHFVGAQGAALLVASMGASAVLLFALPHGPLSQPWAVIGGHGLSAVVGVASASMIADPVTAGAVAVGVAIGVMQLLGCVHPPGGATALSAVVGGPAVQALGLKYVFTPVLMNALLIVTVAVGFHGIPKMRRYPAYLAKPKARPHGDV